MKVSYAAAAAIVFTWMLSSGCASTPERGAAALVSPSGQSIPDTFPETNCAAPNLTRSALEKGYRKCMSAFAGNPSACSTYLQCWNEAK